MQITLILLNADFLAALLPLMCIPAFLSLCSGLVKCTGNLRYAHIAIECSTGNLNDDIADKPSSSDQSESEYGYRPVQQVRIMPLESTSSSATLKEEELLDAMHLLYHLGLAPNFKQVKIFA